MTQSTNSDRQFGLPRMDVKILLLAFAVRVIWSMIVPVIPVSDCFAYDVLAQNMANGHGYRFGPNEPFSAFWPVGYPAVLAALYSVFGHHFWPAVVWNILLGVASVALAMKLGSAWFGPAAGRACGLILALWPSQIEFATVLASETTFIAVTLLALWLWLREQSSAFVTGCLAGVALAAAAYVRPTAVLLPLVFGLAGMVRTQHRWKELMKIAIASTVMLALIAPWSARNYQVFGRFVLVSTNGGVTLWMGNHPGSSGGYYDTPPEVDGMNEAEKDDYLGRIAKEYIVSNPVAFVRGCFAKFIMTHNRETIGVAWNEPGLTRVTGTWCLNPIKIISSGYWYVAALLGLVGLARLIRHDGWVRAGLHPAVLTCLYFVLVHSIIIAQDRYHFALIPYVATLAGLYLAKGKPIIDRTLHM